MELEGTADATWGLDKDVAAIIVTKCGAAVAHGVNNINVKVPSSVEAEGVASLRLAHKVECVQEIERAFGHEGKRPTIIGTDNTGNRAIAMHGGGSAGRSRHSLRRWAQLRERLEAREIYLAYVQTDDMPADFLTKFVSWRKLELSVKRATNSDRALPPN